MPVPLVCLPDRSGDGGGIEGGASGPILVRSRRGGTRTAEQLVKPFGVDLTAEKIGFIEDAAEKAHVRGEGGQWFLRGYCPRR